MLAHLEVGLIDGLGQIVHIHLPVQRKGGRRLDQPLNLSSTEVLSPLCSPTKLLSCLRQGVLCRQCRGHHAWHLLLGSRQAACVHSCSTAAAYWLEPARESSPARDQRSTSLARKELASIFPVWICSAASGTSGEHHSCQLCALLWHKQLHQTCSCIKVAAAACAVPAPCLCSTAGPHVPPLPGPL